VKQTKKTFKERSELNDTVDQGDLADICRIFDTTGTEYTFFAATCRTVSKIGHTLGHKVILNKYVKLR
jgi:exonuclease III